MMRIAKMNKKIALFGSIGLMLIGCNKDDTESPEQQEELTSVEVKTILETDDVSGIADTIIAELYMNDASSAKSAKETECYTASYSETGFTTTFNNCVLNGTENINGTLTVTYAVESETAAFTATFDDFYAGDIKINGTRSFVLNSNSQQGSMSFSVTSDMSVVMADGSTIEENGTKTVGFTFGDSLESSIYTIDGDWTLKIDGDTYAVIVGTTLEGNLSCGYLTTGQMSVDKNGLKVLVGFGDGSCDDMALLTYPNGATQDISLKD